MLKEIRKAKILDWNQKWPATLCFSPCRILRLPRYSLTFGFPWIRPSLHSSWYQWHNCSSNITRIQALFWLGNTPNQQGLLRCASHFLFRACFLWRSAICKLAMKWYPMRMCTRWLCPFKEKAHCHIPLTVFSEYFDLQFNHKNVQCR